MKRFFIVCVMAALVAAGVAQVPMSWEFKGTLPQSIVPVVNLPAPGTVSNVVADAPQIALKVVGSPEPVPTKRQAAPERSTLADVVPAPTPSALPPPPRNGDVPPARAHQQTQPAVPVTQVPMIPVIAELKRVAPPPVEVSRRTVRQPTAKQPTTRPATTAQKPAERPLRIARAKPRNEPSPLRRALAQAAAQPKQTERRPVRVASLPPLAYAYAPPPRSAPLPRRAPAPRQQ